MELVTDLGWSLNKSNHKIRYGIFICPVCKKEFKCEYYPAKNNRHKQCQNCRVKAMTILANKARTKHGMAGTKIFRVWMGIKKRCMSNGYEKKEMYSGRGITMCNEWISDFGVFYEWALSCGYKDGLEIDRIDVNGGYCPENCRWVNNFVNAQNKRLIQKNNTSGYRGVRIIKLKNGISYLSQIRANGKFVRLGVFKDITLAAMAYDEYVLKNNLYHPTNAIKRIDLSKIEHYK